MTTNHICSFLSFFRESEEVRHRNQPYLTGELKNKRVNFSWDIHISPRNKAQNVQKWPRWLAYKFPHTTVSSVSVFEYRMCWKNKPAPITLQDLPCVISLHVWNGWVVTDIWCEFDVNLIFRNILENLENWWCAQYFVSPPHHLDHLSEEQTHNTNSRV